MGTPLLHGPAQQGAAVGVDQISSDESLLCVLVAFSGVEHSFCFVELAQAISLERVVNWWLWRELSVVVSVCCKLTCVSPSIQCLCLFVVTLISARLRG